MRSAKHASDPRPSRRTPADWERVLRGQGLRRTAPRLAVLRELARATAPLTHGDLVDRLAHLPYDRATIYRTLMTLAEVGILRRSDFGGVWRFEVVRTGGSRPEHPAPPHPHFVCEDCGEVSCLPDLSVTLASTRGSPRAVARRRVEIQLRGRCDHCQ